MTDRGDDFASALLEIHDEDPDKLTHEEIASILFSLSFAGHETTNNLLGNCIRRLLEEPAHWQALVTDPELIAGAVDEVLRYDPSVVVWRRQAKQDVVVGGVEIPAGAKLFCGSQPRGATRLRFPSPSALTSAAPTPAAPLPSAGASTSASAPPWGRLEAQVALAELLRHYPRLELVVLLHNIDLQSGLAQRDCRRQAADAPADDKDSLSVPHAL